MILHWHSPVVFCLVHGKCDLRLYRRWVRTFFCFALQIDRSQSLLGNLYYNNNVHFEGVRFICCPHLDIIGPSEARADLMAR